MFFYFCRCNYVTLKTRIYTICYFDQKILPIRKLRKEYKRLKRKWLLETTKRGWRKHFFHSFGQFDILDFLTFSLFLHLLGALSHIPHISAEKGSSLCLFPIFLSPSRPTRCPYTSQQCCVCDIVSWSLRHACTGNGCESSEVTVLGKVPIHVSVPCVLRSCLPWGNGLCSGGLQWDRHAPGQRWGPGCGEPNVEPDSTTAHCKGRSLSCGAGGSGDGAWGYESATDPSGLCGDVPPRWRQMGVKGESEPAVHGRHHVKKR